MPVDELAYPLQINTIRRNSKQNTFGMVRNHHQRAHQGWDLLATPLTPCYAIADGRIARVMASADYGRTILLKFEFNGRTYYAAYCHLSFFEVEQGDLVLRCAQIGRTGNSGNAASMRGADQHLHFEIRTILQPGHGLEGRVDPATLYGTRPLKYTVYQRHNGGVTEIASRPGLKMPGANVVD